MTSVAASFYFNPEALGKLELSWKRLDGLFYWYDRAKELEKKIQNQNGGG